MGQAPSTSKNTKASSRKPVTVKRPPGRPSNTTRAAAASEAAKHKKPTIEPQKPPAITLDCPIVFKSFPALSSSSIKSKPTNNTTIETPSFREIEPPVYPPLNSYASPRKRQRRRSQRLLEREDDDHHDEGDDEHQHTTSSDDSSDEEEEETTRKQSRRHPPFPATPAATTAPASVAFSPLSKTTKLVRLAKRMGMETPELDGNTPLTHVIVSSKDDNQALFELLCGLACGAKIVNSEWLAACNKRGGKALRAGKYLVYQSAEVLRKKARRPLLFAGGTRVCVVVANGGSNREDLSEDQIKALVKFAGGVLVDNFKDCEVCISMRPSKRKNTIDCAAFKAKLLEQQVKM